MYNVYVCVYIYVCICLCIIFKNLCSHMCQLLHVSPPLGVGNIFRLSPKIAWRDLGKNAAYYIPLSTAPHQHPQYILVLLLWNCLDDVCRLWLLCLPCPA